MVTIVNNSVNLNSTYVMNNGFGQSNSIISHNLLDEAKFYETFSTYKIFSLELISVFCNIRKIKSKNLQINELYNETASDSSTMQIMNQWRSAKDYDITSAQELKITNLILESIKTADLDVNYILQSVIDSDIYIYFKLLQERVDSLSKNTMLELRNLLNDLKIYFIGPLDPLIRPWSVVGRYVRRCIIIYEKMSFDKIVILCKQASTQFKILSDQLAKNRLNLASVTSKQSENNTNNNKNTSNNDQHFEIENFHGNHSNSPMSGALFLNDESNLTIMNQTGDYLLNRSANDCSGMDLDESLGHPGHFNSKALTSTVSAQRTQSLSNFKPITDANSIEKPIKIANKTKQQPSTVKFSLQPSQLIKESHASIHQTPVGDLKSMPPPLLPQVPPVPQSNADAASAFTLKNGCAFSRKIAEYFVAQQANLIENNDHDALNPVELHYKIDELLAYDSNFADAYYLKYLNFMRLRDYPSALKALHDYFDRAFFAGSVSLAALNLCSLEYRFDNKENALFALKEAITSAHHEGDNVCLQHCLSWLYKMDSISNSASITRKNFLIKSACSRAINNEIYNLASYNLHFFARTNVGKHRPESIMNLLNKTDIINLKMSSKTEHQLLSHCHKAALWDLYGHKKLSILHAQLLLNFVPKYKSYKINTESQCIAMCYLALNFHQKGMYTTSQSILEFCKEIYSLSSKISEHWIYTENMTLIEKNLLNGKWGLCRLHIEKLASTNFHQALLEEMNVYILEGNIDKAKEVGNTILMNLNITSFEAADFSNLNNNNATTQFEFWTEKMSINLRLNYIQIYISLRQYANALISAIKFYQEVKHLDFNYELMTSCLIIAKILIFMEYPEQAIKYIEKCTVFVMSSSSLLDQAKLHYLYAKCLFLLDKKRNLSNSIEHMRKCVEKLETIQGNIYLVSAYAYLSLLLNHADNLSERNKFAFKFRQLRQQMPLVGYLL